jgi:hypothetical protein
VVHDFDSVGGNLINELPFRGGRRQLTNDQWAHGVVYARARIPRVSLSQHLPRKATGSCSRRHKDNFAWVARWGLYELLCRLTCQPVYTLDCYSVLPGGNSCISSLALLTPHSVQYLSYTKVRLENCVAFNALALALQMDLTRVDVQNLTVAHAMNNWIPKMANYTCWYGSTFE